MLNYFLRGVIAQKKEDGRIDIDRYIYIYIYIYICICTFETAAAGI